ncbi:cinnamoyl-CoA reductase [Cordyceps javanica]|nr:cinnamoyl-CoA reductase [Cordyceps javanica]
MAPTVLVTGASGFIATHVIRAFLARGYNVKGTVRSAKTAAAVKDSHPQFGDQLSTVVVPDIAAPNAFDAAVQGVDGIIHTASPFIFDATDFETELFQPSVQGTTSILEAAFEGLRPGYSYTEKDWNSITKEMAMDSGDGGLAYLVSKTLAEKAAWEFVEANKPKFSVATICPPMVYGPLAHRVDNPGALNTSSMDLFRLVDGSEKTVPQTKFWAFVDVRDEAHLNAFESPAAAGQRYLVASSAFSYQKFCDIVRAEFPKLRGSTPEGVVGEPLPPVYQLDTTKAKKELKMTFRPLEVTVKDTVGGFIGFLKN